MGPNVRPRVDPGCLLTHFGHQIGPLAVKLGPKWVGSLNVLKRTCKEFKEPKKRHTFQSILEPFCAPWVPDWSPCGPNWDPGASKNVEKVHLKTTRKLGALFGGSNLDHFGPKRCAHTLFH